MYKVYVRIDDNARIVSVNSDAFLPSTDGWTLIDQGDTDKFHHAQGNYFQQQIMTDEGVPRYKLVDGEAVERTAAEIAADIAAIPPPPPPTVDEKLAAMKPLMTELVKGKPADIVIQTAEFILPWTEDDYKLDDVRMYDGQPKRCCQAHNSIGNATWNPTVASLWSPYHGTTKATALAWIAPTGAQDMYKTGEYMIWTDGAIMKCIQDTAYSPTEYAQAWEVIL